MTKHGGWWSAVPSLGVRLLGLLLLGVLSCSSDGSGASSGGPLVRLHLSSVDSATTSADLKVTASDPGGQDRSFMMNFADSPFDLLGVSFPSGTRGLTQYEVTLYSTPSCPIASGVASLSLDDDQVYELAVTMKAVALCGNGATLTVQLANVLGGQGSVVSTPAGINCTGGATGCSVFLPKGSKLSLMAMASNGSFAGWTGATCSGTGSCDLTLTQDTQVQAVFTACHGWCMDKVPVTTNLYGIAGTAVNRIVAVGEKGTALLWDGTSWQPQSTLNTTANLRTAGARLGGSSIFVAGDGGTIRQLSDNGWSEVANTLTTENLNSIAIGGGNNPTAFFVGNNGTALLLPSGGNLSSRTSKSGTSRDILSISQNPNSNGNDLLLVGPPYLGFGLALSWDGNNTFKSQMNLFGDHLGVTINAVLCGMSKFYAAGDQGMLIGRTSAGGAAGSADKWATITSPTTLKLRGMWQSSDTNVFAVGDTGLIIQYNGAGWSIVAPITSYTLRAIWGTSESNIYAVGDNGVILHYLP